MVVVEIKSDEQFEQFLEQNKDAVVALNFWASFAAPSIQMNTVFSELSGRFPSTKFLQIDAEEMEDISESFDVNAVPFFVVMKGTEVLSRISGANPAELQASLQRYSINSSNAIPPPLQSQAPPAAAAANSTKTATNGAPSVAETADDEVDLDARLQKLVKAAPVMLFMKGSPSAPQCGFSRTLVGLLREEGIRYGFFNILADNDVRQGLKEFSDWPTFPQLYVGGEFVGGLDVVREMIENGEMTSVLEESGIRSDSTKQN
ncbi:Monothiol glutaredoxin-5 [Taphrina deformans PYCC 5710]|uniref:Monothiol glutaredoxin-5 n=1 Tax=Taphrina deformans (strain PYCC 5710 / ATCC 11124 / CBS 356.35 / IMI 108563 / JCM 9778 / NBRC 8474) TaxID=1097556 RepID=R4XHP8_TAPDE|nr:Monothiol glutaredoxin-5 [Taphrina deformans PYCC 5710]|eukprot:CCG85169.1 Monothiol glutaredoxin-5 [Taphrina deformans PYCC 5710]